MAAQVRRNVSVLVREPGSPSGVRRHPPSARRAAWTSPQLSRPRQPRHGAAVRAVPLRGGGGGGSGRPLVDGDRGVVVGVGADVAAAGLRLGRRRRRGSRLVRRLKSSGRRRLQEQNVDFIFAFDERPTVGRLHSLNTSTSATRFQQLSCRMDPDWSRAVTRSTVSGSTQQNCPLTGVINYCICLSIYRPASAFKT